MYPGVLWILVVIALYMSVYNIAVLLTGRSFMLLRGRHWLFILKVLRNDLIF